MVSPRRRRKFQERTKQIARDTVRDYATPRWVEVNATEVQNLHAGVLMI